MHKNMILLLFAICLVLTKNAWAQNDSAATVNQELADEETTYQFHKKPNIAILPFTDANTQAKEIEFGRTVSAMLITAIRLNSNFSVIERGELQSILAEEASDLSGLTKERSKKIRELLNIDVILAGDVSLIENTLHIDARLFDINTGNIVAALFATCRNLKDIRSEVNQLAFDLEQTYLRQWMGSISITSLLPDAEVYLENRYVGNTKANKPLMINDLIEGRYKLKLIRGGYYDWEGEISIMAKMDRSVKVSLIPKPGSMNISSEPKGAQIYLDNSYVGDTPISLKRVAEGEHEIRLIKNNYKNWTGKVIVRSFQPTDVKTTLEVSPGILSVNSNPMNASIYLKGKFIAQTPYTMSNLSPGEIVLRIEKEGYEDWTTSAIIKPNSHEVIDISLIEKIGKISVTSNPAGAEIYIDQDEMDALFIGTTPLLNHTMKIGSYKVRVVKADYFDAFRDISVKTNEVTECDFGLVEKPGTIFVQSTPENARVFINGRYKGRSPLQISDLDKGNYLITMSMPYASKTVNAEVQSNRETLVRADITKPVNYVYGITIAGLTALVFQYLAK